MPATTSCVVVHAPPFPKSRRARDATQVVARMIPEAPAPDTASAAERRFFTRLRDGTPDEIVAFHHVAWLVPGRDGAPEEGESDFVVAHPDYGVLAVEVKGGRIRYDAVAERWTSSSRSGEVEIKDPFEHDPWAKGKIVRSSIHRFKGLERLVVGLVELESVRHDVLYVGVSRPQVFLSLFWPQDQRDRLPAELAATGSSAPEP